jgi:archaellum component FlaG (FlaF/FlaG flagellin family)
VDLVKGLLTLAGIAVLAFAATAGAGLSGNHGKLGSTLTVKGQTKDVIAVTALKVQDPATGYSPTAGKRVVGISFKVKNVGKVRYKDFPTALLTTRDGESSGSAISTGGSCNSPGLIKLQPGQSKTFCLPFQVAKRAKLMTVQYTPDSGYGTPAVFTLP